MTSANVLILKSLAANWPILKSWGCSCPRILTVVVTKGTQGKIMDVLCNFSTNRNGIEKIKNSDFVFYLGQSGIKHNVERIKENLAWDQKGNQGLPVIVTENPVIEDNSYNQFFIFLDEKEGINYDVKEIVPNPEALHTIHEKILELDKLDLAEEERILLASVYFLEPYCYRKNKPELMNQLLEEVHRLCIVDEEARDLSGLDMVFVRTLYEWQQANKFCEMYELRKLTSTAEDMAQIMLYDAAFIYLHEKLFKGIVEPLTRFVPINSLKKGLLETGIIDVGKDSSTGTATYTVKVGINAQDIGYRRVNLIRLNREKIESGGMLGLVDACLLEKEGMEDE